MKRIAFLLVLASACKTVAVKSPSAGTGAASPKAAVERFVLAARQQDVQALGAAWGDEKGAIRDNMDRQQLEQRSVIVLACLRHDKATVSEMSPGIGGHQTAIVDFTQAKLVASAQFTVTKGPGDRWYVSNFELQKMQNAGFCGKP